MNQDKYFITLTFCFLLLASLVMAQAPSWDWIKGIGGTSHTRCNSMVLDNNKNMYCTGNFQATCDFDPDSLGVHNVTTSPVGAGFICKLDSDATFQWVQQFDYTTADSRIYINKIAVDNFGSIYISGEFEDTMDFDQGPAVFQMSSIGHLSPFIGKYDSLGNFIWVKQLTGSVAGSVDNFLSQMELDESGLYLYLAGIFKDTVDFNPDVSTSFNIISNGKFDIYFLKLDSAGNFIWAKRIGNPNDDDVKNLKVKDDVLILSGFNAQTVDVDPGPGINNVVDNGSYIVMMDTASTFRWVKHFTTNSGLNSIGNFIDDDLNIYFTGGFYSTCNFNPPDTLYNITANGMDGFFVKYDLAGNFKWVKLISGNNNQFVDLIVTDNEHNIYITGQHGDITDFDPDSASIYLLGHYTGWRDLFVAKYDSSGSFIWAKEITGGWDEQFNSLVSPDQNNLYVNGVYHSGAIWYDSSSLVNPHFGGSYSTDIFIGKLNPTTITTTIPIQSNQENISVFPNPTSSKFVVDFGKLLNDAKIEIINLAGEIIFMKSVSDSERIFIDDVLVSGVYFVKVSSNNYFAVRKLIIQ